MKYICENEKIDFNKLSISKNIFFFWGFFYILIGFGEHFRHSDPLR